MDGTEKETAAAPHSIGHQAASEMLSPDVASFSFVSGGPLYQLLLRVGLLKPPLDRTAWRVIVITMIAWAPLLLLSTLRHRIMGGVKIPFLYDVEAQARLLFGLPLLIAGELAIHRGVRMLVLQFVDRKIVTPAALPKFENSVRSTLRLRNSIAIELGLLAFTFMGGSLWWRSILAIQSDTWYASVNGAGNRLSPAGFWYVFVSMPIVQFIALRWYFRLFIWGRMLFQISRLELNLVPIHPDCRCGLGFLGQIVLALAPFLLAHSVLLSGYIANRILYEGIKLPDHGIEIAAVAIFLLLITLGPLCVFTPGLIERRKTAVYSYGSLASEYVIGFNKKWIEGQRPPEEPLMGTSDIQSLADLANSFAIIQNIVPFPFGKESIFLLLALIALPILPLFLTMFSIQELADRLLRVLF
jgi:hypothetical protein